MPPTNQVKSKGNDEAMAEDGKSTGTGDADPPKKTKHNMFGTEKSKIIPRKIPVLRPTQSMSFFTNIILLCEKRNQF